jgi:hypothetical protein
MGERIIHVAEDFWNIRGSFKIAGLIDIGTQASLVRRAGGGFVMLDSYTLADGLAEQVDELTGGRENVEAVLNLHPFHTVHVRAIHERYPDAKHYGTARHLARFPDLGWEKHRSEDEPTHALFRQDLEFSIPQGVDFISENEDLHFSSVLALHRASKTMHVDDTIMYVRLPRIARLIGIPDATSFHPTLAKVLERRAGAAQDFREWANALADRWSDAENLCAAHTSALLAARNDGRSIRDRILAALEGVEGKLAAHERQFG